jgi:hypothetical protein
MSDEKPDPLSDVIKGLGLIFRAAKTTVERMPKKGLEDAVLETAREVGRAIENVAGAVEREVRSRKGAPGAEQQDKDRDKDAASPKEGAGENPGDPPPPKPPGDP